MKTEDNRKRVALVDDDPSVRAAAQVLLESSGLFRVVTSCVCGRDALKAVADVPPDQRPQLVLLDIRMPNLDGIECCQELRHLFPALVIAMFSARRLPCFVNGARQAGADAYYWKGMDTRGLAGALGGLRRTEGMRIGPGVLLGGVTGSTTILRDPRFEVREEEVLELEAGGLSVGEIADKLKLHEQTIYRFRQSGRERLQSAAHR